MMAPLMKGVVKTMLVNFQVSAGFPALLTDDAGTWHAPHVPLDSRYRAVWGRPTHHLAAVQEVTAIAGRVNVEENVRSR